MHMVETGINKKYLTRNYILNTADGALFALAMGMVPLNTVIIYFISGFVAQKWLIGLLTFLNVLLSLSPQILVSKKLEKLRYYKPFTVVTGLMIRGLWLLMGLDVILFADKSPILFTVLFYILYSLIGLASAFAGIGWLNFIVKIIPREYRGRFLGIRSTIAGIFESTGSLVMGVIVKSFPYPFNYAVLFLIVCAVTTVSITILAFSKEHESVKEMGKTENSSYVSRMYNVLVRDVNFTNYLVSVVLVGGFGKMAFAFHVIFAKERLGIGISQVSYATFILLICQSIGYLLWGLLGDKYGFKCTLELSTLIFLPAIFLTYLMSSLLIFYLSMGLFGVAQSARNVNENNLAINLCRNEEEQPLYIGLRNLLVGPFFAFGPVIAGGLYDAFGYQALFIISALFMAAGLYVLRMKVREYR